MLTLKIKSKVKIGKLFWEPLIRLKYRIGWRKYDVLIDVGLSEKTSLSFTKIILARKYNEEIVHDIPQSLMMGFIQEPLNTSAINVINELLTYAKILHIESRKLTKSMSDYAKKIHLWSKYMAFPIDEGARGIIKILRTKEFDKQGIFALKALLHEGLGISNKTDTDKIKILKGSGMLIYCPFYVRVLDEVIRFYDATITECKEDLRYSNIVNEDQSLREYLLSNVLG